MLMKHKKHSSVYGDYWLQMVSPYIFLFIIALPQEGLSDGISMKGVRMINVTEHENGQEIKAHAGDVIQIELESLGSAGYQWFIENLDVNYLKLMAKETELNANKEKIGAPVMHIWRFKVLKKGSTNVSMSHYRVWEGKEKASEHFHIKLTIH